ncbi:MAG: zinc finger domain-containing protein, partial [Alphaproteobacteria bacterium]
SLQASPVLYTTVAYAEAVAGLDLADICITSGMTVRVGETPPAGAFTLSDVPDVAVVPSPASGEKCQRCWKVLPDVGTHGHVGLCGRCAEAVAP